MTERSQPSASPPAPAPNVPSAPASTLTSIRRALLLVLAAALGGTLIELVLLEHYEDVWQWVPLVLLGVAIVVVVWYGATRSRSSLRVLRGLMLLFVLSGATGVALHVRGNLEFELENSPELRGLSLLWEVVTGATPILAPGTMVLLGVIGLLYTYKHPRLIERKLEITAP